MKFSRTRRRLKGRPPGGGGILEDYPFDLPWTVSAYLLEVMLNDHITREKEGKTTVAANLARVVALQGRRVLLIDGSLRKPDIGAAFGLPEAEGLSEFLADGNELSGYITQADGVDILLSKATAEKSAEMLSSPRMKELLEKARETYDVVIVDSAPVTGCADTRILAKEADEILLILQPDVSKLDLAKDSKQMLEAIGVRVAGFALNKVPPKECEFLPLPVANKPQVQD